ncbi:hypothetical protein AVEN_207165-1 [Araneus ventricosus]|uniref:Uncharacterized protein n=1 Tax=Araneus ventricosus TaxID=182803 RepID=A0A4Y2HLE4_ARAVE|nr:hypothetical protein AVEN_207165-1 [Araneus ventricosus]
MNSRRFPSPRKPLWKIRFTTQTPSLTLARPKIRLARLEPTKPAGAGVVVRVLNPNVNRTKLFLFPEKRNFALHSSFEKDGYRYCELGPQATSSDY